MTAPDTPHPKAFYALQPELIIDSVESLGLLCDARIFPLNSYENRVYQIGLEAQPGPSPDSEIHQATRIIGKYYRPERWSNPQILEEHHFTRQLAEQEIPVVAPLEFAGNTLHLHQGYRFALYPQRGGRIAELENPQHLEWIGRFLGRIHAVGASEAFSHRPTFSIEEFARQSADYLCQHRFIPDYLLEPYQRLVEDLLPLLRQRYMVDKADVIRLHGDCHSSNILWTDNGPHFVDFDDCRSGPAIQDLWMLLSGDTHEQQQRLNHLLDGYFEFAELEAAQLALIEPLRTLRLMHYASWLARRWDDPTFPLNFPWFNTHQYWEQHILELKEQFALLQETPGLHL